MKRMIAAFRNDVRFQFRHGFYFAYLIITIMYIVLLSFVPDPWKPMVSVIIIFSDPSALGYFFIGGIVLLEKGQHIYENLFVTPFQISEYLFAKVLSLSMLSVATSLAIHLFTFGFGEISLIFVLGVLITSVFFTLIGLGAAVRCRSLNEFFLVSPLYTLIFTVPLLGYVQWVDTPLYYLLPTQASLLLIEEPFRPLEGGQLIAMLGMLIAWTGLAYGWAHRSFQHYIIGKIGGAT